MKGGTLVRMTPIIQQRQGQPIFQTLDNSL
jgi:hypothetical protein